MKNGYGAEITPARFPRCKKCLYHHENKRCIVKKKRHGSLLLALRSNNADLEKSLDKTFQ